MWKREHCGEMKRPPRQVVYRQVVYHQVVYHQVSGEMHPGKREDRALLGQLTHRINLALTEGVKLVLKVRVVLWDLLREVSTSWICLFPNSSCYEAVR